MDPRKENGPDNAAPLAPQGTPAEETRAGNFSLPLDTATRRKTVLELRLAGATFEEIARQVGLRGKGAAWKAYHAAPQAVYRPAAEEARTLELERLDRLQRPLWTRAVAGDLAAIDAMLRLMARRAKLLGLDAPTRGERANAAEIQPAILILPANGRDEGT